ncbi:MAG: hypothetical protein KF791_18975 [Verrucomicrobiae bacterium]|nr:hypothetical protein [Verrucomicrobiae bacterium]
MDHADMSKRLGTSVLQCRTLATILWLLAGLHPLHSQTVVDYWVAPVSKGSGNGTDENNAALFNQANQANLKARLEDATTYPNLRVRFLGEVDGIPGRYGVSTYLLINGDPDGTPYAQRKRRVALVGETRNGKRARLFLTPYAESANWATTGSGGGPTHRLIVSGSIAGKRYYLKQFRIESLDLDGNFLNMGAWSSEANATGYTSAAIDIMAESGLIKDVRIRNFGSVGNVPSNPIHAFRTAGIEAFPVSIRTFPEPNQEKIGSAPYDYPWIMEDSEISDFHSVHKGYGSMIIANCYQPLGNRGAQDATTIVIRRCQIRTGKDSIAFGVAGKKPEDLDNTAGLVGGIAGQVLFQDNIVLGVGTGFNGDTGYLGPFRFINNAFIDIQNWANIGVADAGKGAVPNIFYWHEKYLFEDNLVRLRGKRIHKSWSDTCLSDFPNVASDPDPALGRYLEPTENLCAGIIFHGFAGSITFKRNDFTTWPRNNFYLPNPGINQSTPPTSITGELAYQLIWKVPTTQSVNCSFYSRTRNPVDAVQFDNSRLSGVPYDFKNLSSLPSGPDPEFTQSSTPSPSVAHRQVRWPHQVPVDGFVPVGELGRMLPQWIQQANVTRLAGAREVQISSVTFVAATGKLQIKGRVVDHPLRASRKAPPSRRGESPESRCASSMTGSPSSLSQSQRWS